MRPVTQHPRQAISVLREVAAVERGNICPVCGDLASECINACGKAGEAKTAAIADEKFSPHVFNAKFLLLKSLPEYAFSKLLHVFLPISDRVMSLASHSASS